MPVFIHQALLLLVLAGTIAAAFCDVRSGLIPNRLVFGMTALGLALRAAAAAPRGLSPLYETFLTSLFGALVCGALPLALYLQRSLGGGDVKLLIACGVCLGPMVGFEIQLFGYGFGLVYALGRLIHEGTLWKTLGELRWIARRPSDGAGDERPAQPARMLCFAPPLAGAALAVTLSYWSWA